MRIGFIGGGKIAEAMISAIIRTRRLGRHEIFVSDTDETRRTALRRHFGIKVYTDNCIVAKETDVIFLCVKPQMMDTILVQLAPAISSHHLVFSVAAGKHIKQIESVLKETRVIRIMPNMASLTGDGMTAYCLGAYTSHSDEEIAIDILGCFGRTVKLPEKMFDAVTALSGSSPAFLAYIIECFTKAGIAEGIDREDAVLLAQQTMLGTAKLLFEKKMSPQDLVTAVATKGGTTAAGLEVLEKSHVGEALMKTIEAAAKRSRELSKA